MTLENLDLLIPADLETELNACKNIPTLPAVALKIIEASKDPDISLHEISAIISSDPAIAAKLLKVANSPLYSQRRSLSNLREALTLLGFNASLTIALSFSLLQSLAGQENYEEYWKRSIISASIARMLGIKLRVIRLEDLFLAGLLQDIGILVLQCINTSVYPEKSNNLTHNERVCFEIKSLGVDHSHIGAWLLKSWNLPEYLIRSVFYSHSLNENVDNTDKDGGIFHYCLNLSGSLADVWLSETPGKLLLANLDVAKNTLRVSNEQLNELIVDIDTSLPEFSAMFEMSLVSNKERENVIFEAKELLLTRSLHTIKKSEDDRKYIDSITDRVEKIEKESRLDHLTGVFNRQYIDHLLENEYEESNINHWPLSLVFIDIDDFKLINDTFGHLGGDEVLKVISNFFSDNIRETDCIARYGGDEFLLMLPGSTSEIAETLIERLLELFKEKVKVKVKDMDVEVSVSIGVATHVGKHDFDNLKELMDAADNALYKAKASGKNCFAIY